MKKIVWYSTVKTTLREAEDVDWKSSLMNSPGNR